MARPIELLWEALEARDCHPRGVDDKFTALCPAHSDHNPSLTCGVGNDDRALLHCWTGCSLDDILAALDLEKRDLFVDDPVRG